MTDYDRLDGTESDENPSGGVTGPENSTQRHTEARNPTAQFPRETPPPLPPWAINYLPFLFRDWDIPDDPFDPTAWHNPERNPK